MVDQKVLERIRGFLVRVARTYTPLAPFLLGIHLKIGSWRHGRDEKGWRLRQAEIDASLESDEGREREREYCKRSDKEVLSVLVGAVPLLRDDVDVSIHLT
jgi:hypothetical protein